MQLSRLTVDGLFGRFNHSIEFPTSPEPHSEPTVVILHGPNGIGKTTVLRMLNGMMSLDFTMFRDVPVDGASLTFNTGETLRVSFIEPDRALLVSFDSVEARLHPEKSGPWHEADSEPVEQFRAHFRRTTESLTFEYLDTERGRYAPEALDPDLSADYERYVRQQAVTAKSHLIWDRNVNRAVERALVRRSSESRSPLADKLRQFISAAQLDSPTFFGPNEPDLFLQILADLSGSEAPVDLDDTLVKLERVQHLEQIQGRLGLVRDKWDYDRLMAQVFGKGGKRRIDERALVVLSTYADFLTSRVLTRQLIADRLLNFERIMADFFLGKQVSVHAKHGLRIVGDDGSALPETKLSSGEHQLLYLMVSALTTRRRGTVIAIDEPELSMHIAWQRRLVPSLLECASHAAPQVILATHSPDIATGYKQSMVDLGGSYE